MGAFGWSYPAGCSGPPDDEDGPLECVCGRPNWDEEKQMDACAAAPDFCSVECRDRHENEQREIADALHRAHKGAGE